MGVILIPDDPRGSSPCLFIVLWRLLRALGRIKKERAKGEAEQPHGNLIRKARFVFEGL